MIINQHILAVLRSLFCIKNYRKLYIKEATTKAATTKFLSKVPSSKKISDEQFNLCEANLSLDEIKKLIKSQTNKKSSGNDAL